MYSNQYYLLMRIPTRMNKPFNTTEKEKLEATRIEHNRLFKLMSNKNTANRKYISKIDTYANGCLGFYLETEKPLSNPGRYGNALRFFSALVGENGLDLYIKNKRFMKAA